MGGYNDPLRPRATLNDPGSRGRRLWNDVKRYPPPEHRPCINCKRMGEGT